MDEKLELRDIINLIKERAGMIFLIVLGAIALAGGISYYIISPVYQSSTQILVSQDVEGEQGLPEREVQADLQLVNTYRELIESPIIMGEVIKQLGLNTTVRELQKQITVNSNADSQLIEIAVADKSRGEAADIANATALIFQEEVKNILNVNNVKILFPATEIDNTKPISPSPLFSMAIGAALGLILGLGVAFLLSYLDTSIKNERDIEQYLGVPVLATLSTMKENNKIEGAAKVILHEKEA